MFANEPLCIPELENMLAAYLQHPESFDPKSTLILHEIRYLRTCCVVGRAEIREMRRKIQRQSKEITRLINQYEPAAANVSQAA